MSKHGKLVNVLMKLHFIEDSQRSIKEIRQQIERYEEESRTCFEMAKRNAKFGTE